MFRLFKPKEPAPAPAPPAAPPPVPPPVPAPEANAPAPAEPVKPAGALVFSQKPPDASGVQKIVPRQGSIAAALKAATAPTSANASPTQSAIFRPKVSVIIKPGAAAPAAPAPDAPAAAAASDASNLPASIVIPTQELLALFPEHALIENAANHSSLPPQVSIPAQDIVSQLSKGRVQLPITALVALIPKEIIEPSFSATEDVKIKLPLHLILPQLPESAMSLPTGQTKQEMDPNLASPFSERKGAGQKPPSASTVTPKAVAPVPAPAPVAPAVPVAAAAPTTPPPAAVPAAPAASPASIPPVSALKPPSVAAPASSINPADATKAISQTIGLPSKPILPPKSSVSSLKPPAVPPPISIPKPNLPAPSVPVPPVSSPPAPAPAVTPPQSEAKAPAIPPPNIPPPKLAAPQAPAPVETKPPAMPSSSSVTKPLVPPTIPAPNIPPPSIGLKSPEKPPAIPSLSPPASVPTSQPPAEKIPEKPAIPAPSVAQKQPEKVEVPAPKQSDGAGLKNLSEWLGIPEGDIKLPEIAQKIRDKMKLEGVLIATKDGLPLVTAMPAQFDVNSWSGFASHLFKKFDGDGNSLAGSPKKYLLSLGSSWISAYDEKGIYLFLVHSLDALSPEFEQQGFKLAKDLSQFCDNKPTA